MAEDIRPPLPASHRCAECVAVLITLLGVFAPVVSPDDPLRPNVLARAQGPSWQHWLGTDFIGRDVLSRIVHGTKWSLFVAVTSVLLGTTLGAVWGVASAFLGGTFDLLGRACGRGAAVLSADTPGAVARLGPWSEHGDGHPVHRRHQGGLWRPDHPVPGLGREGDPIRRSRPEPRVLRPGGSSSATSRPSASGRTWFSSRRPSASPSCSRPRWASWAPGFRLPRRPGATCWATRPPC